MPSDYWNQFTRNRITRRQALVTASSGGLSLAALTILACGGGESTSKGDKPQGTGLLTPRVDTTKSAVPGGVLKTVQASELSKLDSLTAPQPGTTGVSAGYLYGRL